jgi:hypothetical protein
VKRVELLFLLLERMTHTGNFSRCLPRKPDVSISVVQYSSSIHYKRGDIVLRSHKSVVVLCAAAWAYENRLFKVKSQKKNGR